LFDPGIYPITDDCWLKSLAKLDYLLEERPAEIAKAKENGCKVLGYFCSYVPEEIVHAAGMIPIRLARRGKNAAVSMGNTYLSPSSCPYACSCVGIKKGKRDPYFQAVDLIADAPACMQMRRVVEVWEKYFSVPVIPIAFPRKFYSKEGLVYFSESLQILASELGKITGKAVSAQALEDSIALYKRIRDGQRRLYENLKADVPKLGWENILNVIRAGFVLDRIKYVDFLEELVNEMDQVPSAPRSSSLRLMVAGGMMAPGDDTLLNILKSLGETFIMDELCSGSRGIYGNVSEPTLEAIGQRYLENVPCSSLPYPHKEDDPRLKHLSELIRDYRINGFVYYTLRFCDAYSFKVKQISQLVRGLGVDFIHLSSGYQESDEGQIKTRLEAFVEILESKIPSP
jgi:benzoyl-CoA reductase/2-hydroxyglutaryl-CoA dehydratase subunit BcrC/BadD/HgdB